MIRKVRVVRFDASIERKCDGQESNSRGHRAANVCSGSIVQCDGDCCSVSSGDSELVDRPRDDILVIRTIGALEPDRGRLFNAEKEIRTEPGSVYRDLESPSSHSDCVHQDESPRKWFTRDG